MKRPLLLIFGAVFALALGTSGALAVTVDFDYLPGPDGECGTADDVPMPALTEIVDQYNSCGVTIENTVSSTGNPGLYAVPQGDPGSESYDIVPTTPPHAAAPLDIPMDPNTSSTGFITFTFFPYASDFSIDLIDVEGSGTPGTGNTYIDVFLSSDVSMVAERLLVPSGPTGNQVMMSYSAPGDDTIAKILIPLNGTVIGGAAAAIDTLVCHVPEEPGGCWLTSGGWLNAAAKAAARERHSFGGNVGPPPSGAWEHQDHANGLNFHSNDAHIVECYHDGGEGPGNPRAKPNVALFTGTGRLKAAGGEWEWGYCFDAQVIDRGEPGKKDRYMIEVRDCDSGDVMIYINRQLSGGNIQIHPPNPSLSRLRSR